MPTKTPSSTVEINGYALRVIRKLMNVSPSELATKIKRDRTYLVKIETGHARVSDETFNALLDALAITDRRALLATPHPPPKATGAAKKAAAA